jgi:hypothetical protein
MSMELRPLRNSDNELLTALEQQEDVWEFIGTLPGSAGGSDPSLHLFAVVDGTNSLGIAGLVPSQALGANDFELICAMREEAQLQGHAKHACRLALTWAFDTGGLERVIASIDEANVGARSIASKIGMREARTLPTGRTVYVISRDEYRLLPAASLPRGSNLRAPPQ